MDIPAENSEAQIVPNLTKKVLPRNSNKYFSFGVLIVTLLILPLATLIALNPVRPKPRAAEPATTTINYTYQLVSNYEMSDSPDWQTSENYGYAIVPNIKYHADTGKLGLKLDFYGESREFNGAANIYLKSANNFQEDFIVMTQDPANWIHYTSPEITVPQGPACYDIFNSPERNELYYKGTICGKYYILTSGHQVIYSPSAHFYINFDYSGGNMGAMSMGAIFDRKSYLNDTIYNNRAGEKTVYFTHEYLSGAHFSNVEYTVDALLSGVPENLVGQMCGNGNDPNLRPQLHQGADRTLPQGGSWLDYTEKIGYCSFKYRAISPTEFIYGYISHSPLVRRTASLVTSTPTPIYPTNTPTPTYVLIPTPTPGGGNPVSWTTGNVVLKASDFYIMANGQKYYAKPGPVSVHSDPGNSTYTTLELMWQENSREMRLYLYFNADGRYWWSPEIRTYNGSQPGDWIIYNNGPYFKESLDIPFSASQLIIQDPAHPTLNYIYFSNLSIRTLFMRVTPTPTPTPRISPPPPTVTIVPTNTPIPTKIPTPTPTPYSLRVNTGGPQYIGGGVTWKVDRAYVVGSFGYIGGSTYSTVNTVTKTTDPTLYKTERYGMSAYKFTVPNGVYKVTLKFAEIFDGCKYVGCRVFDVKIGNITVLGDFDIYKSAGGAYKAIDGSYTTNVTNGILTISFVKKTNNPQINAIEIVKL